MSAEYDASQPSARTRAECDEAVGKRASLTLTGTIVAASESPKGPFVKFVLDERWGFERDFSIMIDLDPFEFS